MKFTAWQRTALEYPAYLGIETAHPRFAHVVHDGSIVLTINTGYE